jgi:eukaryotic-like serine/threonine-protein kinase
LYSTSPSPCLQVSAGAPVGSLTHAAPELLDSQSITVQSDVYAFGMLMYELISGRQPFKGYSAAELIVEKATKPAAEMLELPNPDSDEILAAFAEVQSFRDLL